MIVILNAQIVATFYGHMTQPKSFQWNNIGYLDQRFPRQSMTLAKKNCPVYPSPPVPRRSKLGIRFFAITVAHYYYYYSIGRRDLRVSTGTRISLSLLSHDPSAVYGIIVIIFR